MRVAAGGAVDLETVASAWASFAGSCGTDYAQAFVQELYDLRVETQDGASRGLVLDRRAGVGLLVRRGTAWSYGWADLSDPSHVADLASWLDRSGGSGSHPAPLTTMPPVEDHHRARLRTFIDGIADSDHDPSHRDVEDSPDPAARTILTEELFAGSAWVADTDGLVALTHRCGVRRRCTVVRSADHGTARGFGRWYGAPDADRQLVLAQIVSGATRQAEAATRGRSLGTRKTQVLFGPGVGAGLVHELLAHGLEADNYRRPGSYLGGRMGHRIAPSTLTVCDDPSWLGGYGSLAVDDEGTPARTVPLLVDGVVDGLLHSRRTAAEGADEPTGHGRRRDYRHRPVPRATNTVVANGPERAAALAEPAPGGLLRVHALGAGTVDNRSGEFQFMATEAELVTTHGEAVPLRDVMIRGRALDVLSRLVAVADDTAADNTSCFKDGQYVGVGTASPTMLFDELEWRS